MFKLLQALVGENLLHFQSEHTDKILLMIRVVLSLSSRQSPDSSNTTHGNKYNVDII